MSSEKKINKNFPFYKILKIEIRTQINPKILITSTKTMHFYYLKGQKLDKKVKKIVRETLTSELIGIINMRFELRAIQRYDEGGIKIIVIYVT